MDEQEAARGKLEALGGKRVDDTGKLGDSHDGGKLFGASRRSRCLSQISESMSHRSSSAGVRVGKQYHQMDNLVISCLLGEGVTLHNSFSDASILKDPPNFNISDFCRMI